MKPALIFIPCYNCAAQLERLLKSLPHELARRADIMIVDNNSMDHVADVAHSVARTLPQFNIRIYRNEKNYGLGGSFKNAFEAARTEGYTHLVLLHGDNQANPLDVMRLLNIAEVRPELSAVFGARFMPGAKRSAFAFRRLIANQVINGIASLLSRRQIFESGSGLSVFAVEKLSSAFIGRLPDHIAFDFQILLYLIEIKAEFVFEPIEWKSEDEVTTVSEIAVALTLLKQLAQWRFQGGKSRFENWPWIGVRPWHSLS